MRRFLFDTPVFVYALGAEHPYREPCRAIVHDQREGRLAGEVSADLVQEFAHRRFLQRRDRGEAAARARDIVDICHVHELRANDLLRALLLYEQHPRLHARDAVFAAVAISRGLDVILSSDRAFDDVPGLERVDPLDAAAVQGLTT